MFLEELFFVSYYYDDSTDFPYSSGWNTGIGVVSGTETRRSGRSGIFNQSGRAAPGSFLDITLHIGAV